ncbi:fumarylacetoacetate hydrolase family protein [Paraburkholderia nodosa]|uniref:fumarylacetoacetate hydrolase family protein n=1 Tax=Paraburkholderia nodosa TaxID=392320 RepID=UPI00047F9387|nr:fumarylacetoacetate hydrolase family protein [Paraburkholderia nodosa]
MKLLRYGSAGAELPGVLDSEGRIRALSPIVRDIDQDVLSPEGRRFLSAVDVTQLPVVPGTPRLGPPVRSVREIIAIGLNYSDHALEAALPIPDEPVVFGKSTSSISGPYDDIVLAPGSTRTDWEIELGIVMGSVASRVGPDEAMASVAGYCMVNDVSERQWQLHHNGQWGKGKSFDTYTPIGPWLVTPDEIANPQALELRLSVNDQQRQLGRTEDMICGVAHLVSYCSQFMTLQPGDLIITGTPAGVGLGMKPPAYLAAGDVITMGITGLGQQRHVVREAQQV